MAFNNQEKQKKEELGEINSSIQEGNHTEDEYDIHPRQHKSPTSQQLQKGNTYAIQDSIQNNDPKINKSSQQFKDSDNKILSIGSKEESSNILITSPIPIFRNNVLSSRTEENNTFISKPDIIMSESPNKQFQDMIKDDYYNYTSSIRDNKDQRKEEANQKYFPSTKQFESMEINRHYDDKSITLNGLLTSINNQNENGNSLSYLNESNQQFNMKFKSHKNKNLKADQRGYDKKLDKVNQDVNDNTIYNTHFQKQQNQQDQFQKNFNVNGGQNQLSLFENRLNNIDESQNKKDLWDINIQNIEDGQQSQFNQKYQYQDKQQQNNNEYTPEQTQQKVVFDQQQPSNLSSKIKDADPKLNENKEKGTDNLSTQRFSDISLHLHKLIKGKKNLQTQELKKVILLQLLGILVEIIQIIRREFQSSNYTFVILASISIGIEILSITPILIYLQNISSQIQQNHFKKVYFFAFSQIIRVVIFLNTFIVYNQNIIALELLVRQVYLNFQIFRLKSKLLIFESLLFIIGAINLLDYDVGNIYLQLLQWMVMIIMTLLTQFYFKEFPYNLCKLYNAENEGYYQMKRSYFSQKILESQLNDLIPTSKNNNLNNQNNNMMSGGKINNGTAATTMTPNEMWKLQHNKLSNENNVQYIDAINKHEAKKLLTQHTSFIFINDKIQTIFISNKICKEVQSIFSKKDKDVNAASNIQSMIDSNQQKQNIPISPQDNFYKMFDQLLEKVIIERVDLETLTLWEGYCKQIQRPSYVVLNNVNESSSQFIANKYKIFQNQDQLNHNSYFQQPIQVSQFHPYGQNASNLKENMQTRNSFFNFNKASVSAFTYNNIGFSQKIGLKSKNIMLSIKDFLNQISNNWQYFKKYYTNKPIVVASFISEDNDLNINELKKYQLKIYPQYKKQQNSNNENVTVSQASVQSRVGITTSKKFIQDNDNDLIDCPTSYLIVFEEVNSREKIITKAQFYQFLKSLFRCFNNDLTQSLSKILGASQAGVQNTEMKEEMKDKYIRPILLSCRIIKYILHNLRDFNDLVGERFQLQLAETSIPKVAEDSVVLFKATSDKQISFKVIINSEVPLVIFTDQRRLIQIIITLLSNAHRHTQSGSLVFRIFHPLHRGMVMKNQLRFQVEDTGEGMDESIQLRLSKLFNSGIGYSDFKTISTLGFNLFICNIIAKKLFNPEYQYQDKEQRDFAQDLSSEGSGIKFRSTLNKGSVFYFDIKLIDEKKADKLQDSVFNYISGNAPTPTMADYISNRNNQITKSNILITNSIPATLNLQSTFASSEKENQQQINALNKFVSRQQSRNSSMLTQVVDGLDIAEEDGNINLILFNII